jgi:predicted DCC family thiol-disulfide oxidoreductase YuxK
MKEGQTIRFPSEWTEHERIVLFDGACRWCVKWVGFVARHDPLGRFKFETFLLVERGRIYTKSTAALRVAKQLSGLVSLLYLCILIPRPLRDALYDYVARRRYRWRGKSEICPLPPPSSRSRLL